MDVLGVDVQLLSLMSFPDVSYDPLLLISSVQCLGVA